ncbi:MAG: hypothetical protein ABS910_07015 [Arthrobacter sp.]
MNQKKNSRPDALNNEALNPAAVESAAVEEPLRGKRRSRRSTSAPTRLRQAAELLHTAPAAAAPRSAPGSGGPDGQRSEASKHEAADRDSGTNGNQPAGTPFGRTGTGILPQSAAEDDPRAWGDAPEDTSAWLREQRPPHWG